MSNYLHECLDRHRDVTRALYGTPQELREVQRQTASIVASGRLTYDDVEIITQTGLWRVQPQGRTPRRLVKLG